MDAPRSVDVETIVRARPEQVWDAMATPAGMHRWFTTGTTMDPAAGGELVLLEFRGEHGVTY